MGPEEECKLDDFDEDWYSATYPDVSQTNLSPAEHYLKIGIKLGRKPNAHPSLFTHYQEIVTLIEQDAGQYQSPYYPRLKEIILSTKDVEMLQHIKTGLVTLGHVRSGRSIPSSEPLVSIIMPTYNRASLITEAIASVWAQTHVNFELLICDDASTDQTLDILTGLDDKRIVVLRHDHRQGAAAARNTCLQQATGEWIAYLDTDNLWHPRYLELMLNHLEAKPGYVSAYADYYDISINYDTSINMNSIVLGQIIPQDFQLEAQLRKPMIDLNSFMHHQSLTQALGYFDESLERLQDKDIITRYCWTHEPLHVPLMLNLYQRISSLETITSQYKNSNHARRRIQQKVQIAYLHGQPISLPTWLKKISILTCDTDIQNLEQAHAVAEALSTCLDVQLIILSRHVSPPCIFPTLYVRQIYRITPESAVQPTLNQIAKGIMGDVIYCLSNNFFALGSALLCNSKTGSPILMDYSAQLNCVLPSPWASVDSDKTLISPEENWTDLLAQQALQLPVLQLEHVRSPSTYNPEVYDREHLRYQLGFATTDCVMLIHQYRQGDALQLIQQLQNINHSQFKQLIINHSPDSSVPEAPGRRIIQAQAFEQMAALMQAADAVILWYDPASSKPYPPELTEALAMGTTIVASLNLPRHYSAHNLAFGDYKQLHQVLATACSHLQYNPPQSEQNRAIFLREYSYHSALTTLALTAWQLPGNKVVYPMTTAFTSLLIKPC